MKEITKISLLLILFLVGCGNESTSSVQTLVEVNTTLNPNADKEPYFKYTWHLNAANTELNTKGFVINEYADINISSAWTKTQGAGVRIAIIDDSFDVVHEDLKENIYLTYNANDGSSNVKNTSTIYASHGNTCAGFTASPINGKGIIGSAPGAKLILIKENVGLLGDIIKAFEYAKNNGAKVISCSWGTESIDDALQTELKAMYDAGITVLFASGNDKKDLDKPLVNDESESPWVIGIGASSESNDVTTYSNYGKEIDLLAPGGENPGVLGLDDTGDLGSAYQFGLVSNNYAFGLGTSYSTPVAAGVVALMYGIKPTLTPKEIRDILIETADKVGDGSENYISGFDTYRAFGKINASRAIEKLLSL